MLHSLTLTSCPGLNPTLDALHALCELAGRYTCGSNLALIADWRQFLLGAMQSLTLIYSVIFKKANCFYETKAKDCTKQSSPFRPG